MADRWMDADDLTSVYDRHGPWCHRLEPLDRLLVGRARRRLFGGVDGTILDVACGTGTNLPYVHRSATVTGVDLSPRMLAIAARRLEDLPLDATLCRMDAAELGVRDDRFDVVTSALATCTFPDPVAALDEMSRVCRPDGRVLLLEHGRSSVDAIASVQERLAAPYYRRTGCRWAQQPREHLAASDLIPSTVRSGGLGLLTAIEARPPG